MARFAAGDPARLQGLLDDLRARRAAAVFSGVTGVERDAEAVVVRFGDGPEPGLQRVGGAQVAWHLHGVVPRRRRSPTRG